MGKLSTITLVCITLLLLFITIFGNYGLTQLTTLNSQVEKMRSKNEQLEAEIVQLENKIHATEFSTSELEKNAREQLGLSKPGEIVYIFPTKEKSR